MVGMEVANRAAMQMKVEELATLTADYVSRVRISITEDDIAEMVIGLRQAGDSIKFAQNGRVFISSVQPVLTSGAVTGQTIRWQRCFGAHAANSSYGLQGETITGANSIGPTGNKIGASNNSELIFVELVYTYKPWFNFTGFTTEDIRTTRAFSVRERIDNAIKAGTSTARTCGLSHTAT